MSNIINITDPKIGDMTPSQWREALDRLDSPLEVKKAAARIIWWDWFADQDAKDRWNNLDDLLSYDDSEVDDNQLAMALVRTGGYTLEQAQKRV